MDSDANTTHADIHTDTDTGVGLSYTTLEHRLSNASNMVNKLLMRGVDKIAIRAQYNACALHYLRSIFANSGRNNGTDADKGVQVKAKQKRAQQNSMLASRATARNQRRVDVGPLFNQAALS